MEDFIVYSDGGGERGSNAAGACIVHDTSTDSYTCLVVFLGGATNNEAEISAGLLGLSQVGLFCESLGTRDVSVRWVADSEYTLKSATEYIHNWQRNGWKTAAKKPVKNQGLWNAYLHLARDFKIIPEHVRGHTGHTENEACDTASTWAQAQAASELEMGGEGSTFSSGFGDDFDEWILFDGRDFLALMREEGPYDEEALTELCERVRKFQSEKGSSSASPEAKSQFLRNALNKKLEEAAEVAQKLDDVSGSKLAPKILKLMN